MNKYKEKLLLISSQKDNGPADAINKIRVYRINKTLLTFPNDGRSSNILARILALRDIFKILRSRGISINIISFIFKRYSEKIKTVYKFVGC